MFASSSDDFFTASSLNLNRLPTYEDIIKIYLHEMKILRVHQKKVTSSAKLKQMYADINSKVQAIWQKVGLQTIEKTSTLRKIFSYIQKFRQLQKTPKDRRRNELEQRKLKLFFDNSKTLFDIAVCKCSRNVTCKCKKKIQSELLKNFLEDQRQSRVMRVENIIRKRRSETVSSSTVLSDPQLSSSTIDHLSQPLSSSPVVRFDMIESQSSSQTQQGDSQNVHTDSSFVVSLFIYII